MGAKGDLLTGRADLRFAFFDVSAVFEAQRLSVEAHPSHFVAIQQKSMPLTQSMTLASYLKCYMFLSFFLS